MLVDQLGLICSFNRIDLCTLVLCRLPLRYSAATSGFLDSFLCYWFLRGAIPSLRNPPVAAEEIMVKHEAKFLSCPEMKTRCGTSAIDTYHIATSIIEQITLSPQTPT